MSEPTQECKSNSNTDESSYEDSICNCIENPEFIIVDPLPISSFFGSKVYSEYNPLFSVYLKKDLYDMMNKLNEHSYKYAILETYGKEKHTRWLLTYEWKLEDDIIFYAKEHDLQIVYGVHPKTIQHICENITTEISSNYYLLWNFKYGTNEIEDCILIVPKRDGDNKVLINTFNKKWLTKEYYTYEAGAIIFRISFESLQTIDIDLIQTIITRENIYYKDQNLIIFELI